MISTRLPVLIVSPSLSALCIDVSLIGLSVETVCGDVCEAAPPLSRTFSCFLRTSLHSLLLPVAPRDAVEQYSKQFNQQFLITSLAAAAHAAQARAGGRAESLHG